METKLVKIEEIPQCTEQLAEAGKILRRGGLVAIPTETVYGLAANALDSSAVKKIFEAKGRPQDNPLIVHVASTDEVASLVEKVDPRFYELAEKFWPGPLTIIMKKSALVPDTTSGGLDTVAIRMPSNPVANAIIKAAGVPLAAPSANTSGKPSPTTAAHVFDDMNGKIDMIVDGGKCEIGVESTVITLVTNPPRLLRPGGITPEMLREILPDICTDKAVFSKLDNGEKAQSPGMKYKHYSPDANVFLLRGSLENSVKYVDMAADDNSCVVCFDGEADKFRIKAIEYGKENDGLSLAGNVFEVLRSLDDMKISSAFVRCPRPEGVGLAVYNRLLRSAAFKVIDVDSDLTVVGLTGPTGAGKSTVSEFLGENGFYIIDGDLLAKEAVKNKDVLEALALEFGQDIIKEDGSLDRRLTAQRAFATPEKNKALNDITHPAITALTNLELEHARSIGAKYALIDAAALLESPIKDMCDIIACVLAPVETRLERIIARDSITREHALTRINAQHPDSYYISGTDFVIKNRSGDGYKTDALKLIKKLTEKSNA